MKKSIVYLCIGMLGMATLTTACKSNEKKAQEEVVDAIQDQAEATMEYESAVVGGESQYDVFKKEIDKVIADNDRLIAEMRAKVASQSKEVRDVVETKIKVIEERNDKLEDAVDDYKEGAGETWDAFQARINQSVSDIKTDFDAYNKEYQFK